MSWGKRLTETEKRQIVQMHEKGETFEAIAETLDRPKQTIGNWWKNHRTNLEETNPRPVKQNRPCMCCGKTFLSAGSHNRLCCKCKQIETSRFDYLGGVV